MKANRRSLLAVAALVMAEAFTACGALAGLEQHAAPILATGEEGEPEPEPPPDDDARPSPTLPLPPPALAYGQSMTPRTAASAA